MSLHFFFCHFLCFMSFLYLLFFSLSHASNELSWSPFAWGCLDFPSTMNILLDREFWVDSTPNILPSGLRGFWWEIQYCSNRFPCKLGEHILSLLSGCLLCLQLSQVWLRDVSKWIFHRFLSASWICRCIRIAKFRSSQSLFLSILLVLLFLLILSEFSNRIFNFC